METIRARFGNRVTRHYETLGSSPTKSMITTFDLTGEHSERAERPADTRQRRGWKPGRCRHRRRPPGRLLSTRGFSRRDHRASHLGYNTAMSSPTEHARAVEAAFSASLLAALPQPARDEVRQHTVRIELPGGTLLYRQQDEPACALVVGRAAQRLSAPPLAGVVPSDPGGDAARTAGAICGELPGHARRHRTARGDTRTYTWPPFGSGHDAGADLPARRRCFLYPGADVGGHSRWCFHKPSCCPNHPRGRSGFLRQHSDGLPSQPRPGCRRPTGSKCDRFGGCRVDASPLELSGCRAPRFSRGGDDLGVRDTGEHQALYHTKGGGSSGADD